MLKGHDTWLRHYKATWWVTFSSHQSHIHYYVSIQTLTTLNLGWNNVGAAGAIHMAQALQSNMVSEVLSTSFTYPLLCFDTDTHDTGSWFEQCRWWRGKTHGSGITKQHGEWSSFHISHISTIMFRYRHSPRWIFTRTMSVMTVHNTWLMHYKATRWVTFSSHQSHIHYYVWIQTLTTLNLNSNNIGDEGARHMAQALQSNTVSEVLSTSVTYPLLCFDTDTHHAESLREQCRWWWCTTPGSCITKQHGEWSSFHISHISTIMFRYRHSRH
jgi:hypothetical protein